MERLLFVRYGLLFHEIYGQPLAVYIMPPVFSSAARACAMTSL